MKRSWSHIFGTQKDNSHGLAKVGLLDRYGEELNKAQLYLQKKKFQFIQANA